LEALNLSSVMTAGSGSDMSAVRKLISLDSLLANNKNGRLKDLGDVYHDISLVSSSLLTDSKFGGLKQDLNIMFSQEKLPEEFRGDTADIGLRPYTSEDGNPSDQNRPIGSWNQLYLWANVGRPGRLRHPAMERKLSQHADCSGLRSQHGDDGQPPHVHAPSHPPALLFLRRA